VKCKIKRTFHRKKKKKRKTAMSRKKSDTEMEVDEEYSVGGNFFPLPSFSVVLFPFHFFCLLVFKELDEEEIDDELELPKTLHHLSLDEKKELLKFKRDHTEVELLSCHLSVSHC
jgi:hypothetical protein